MIYFKFCTFRSYDSIKIQSDILIQCKYSDILIQIECRVTYIKIQTSKPKYSEAWRNKRITNLLNIFHLGMLGPAGS